jgi:hypothetical protein
MWLRVCLSFALIAAIPGRSQVTIGGGAGPGYTDGLGSSGQMRTPPPVNGDSYPTATGSEAKSNFLRLGLMVTTSYSDNVLGDALKPISDVSYLIDPLIAMDKTTSRAHLTFSYTPGFTIYQQTSVLNQTSQFLTLASAYRLTRHSTLSLQDSFQYTSNFLDQPDLLATDVNPVSSTPLYNIIAPVAGQLANGARAEFTYQFSMNGMLGASGTFTQLHYLKTTDNLGIYDSKSGGGSVFYNRRLSKRHYIGGSYQHSETVAYPINAKSTIQSDTFFLFYTIYLKPTFSFSFSGGPQHYVISQFPIPGYGSWSPTLTGSMGWQGRHTNFSANFSRVVGGGGGLVGAFQSLYLGTSGRWLFARDWSVGFTGSYVNNKDVTPSGLISTEGGHSILGMASGQHQLSQRWSMEFGYTRLVQIYSGIPVVSRAPYTNREFVSFSYRFARPLGG